MQPSLQHYLWQNVLLFHVHCWCLVWDRPCSVSRLALTHVPLLPRWQWWGDVWMKCLRCRRWYIDTSCSGYPSLLVMSVTPEHSAMSTDAAMVATSSMALKLRKWYAVFCSKPEQFQRISVGLTTAATKHYFCCNFQCCITPPPWKSSQSVVGRWRWHCCCAGCCSCSCCVTWL